MIQIRAAARDSFLLLHGLSVDSLHLLNNLIPIVGDTVLQPFLAVQVRLGEQFQALYVLDVIGPGGKPEAYLGDGRVWRTPLYVVFGLSLGQPAAALHQMSDEHALDVALSLWEE